MQKKSKTNVKGTENECKTKVNEGKKKVKRI